MTTHHHDVAVVGAGHNGLVAAALLARAGMRVVVLERLDRVGGAAVTVTPFAGRSARVSRYADSVALPEPLVRELGLELDLLPRPVAAALPLERGARDHDAWAGFHAGVASLVDAVTPTLLEPLPWERDVAAQVDEATWGDLVTTPLGAVLERRFPDDTVRGLLAFPAVAGAFAALDDPSLRQNRCFLHHALGAGARVPRGGAGAVSEALLSATTSAGVEVWLSTGVSAVRPGQDRHEVDFGGPSGPGTVTASYVLADVAPWVLDILLGEQADPATKPAGAQLKINLLLDRLPRLRSGIDPAAAFGRALHVGTSYAGLQRAHDEAAAGSLPSTLPFTVTSPSLADPGLLGDEPTGTATLAVYATHAPAALFGADSEGARVDAVRRVLAALDEHLVDPIESVLARDEQGRLCIDAVTPVDAETDLALPGGHPHHGDLDWPWAPNRARLETPEQRWGVQTGLDRVFLAGAGARRGGSVTGIAGHSAAQAVLTSR